MLVSAIFFVETRLFPSLANTKFVFRNNPSPYFITPFYVFFSRTEDTPYNCLYWEAAPKKGTFFRPQGEILHFGL